MNSLIRFIISTLNKLMKDDIRRILRQSYGKFETHLEEVYATKMTEHISKGDWNNKVEWATYNQVILELKHNLKDMLKVRRLQYNLTEGNNPKKVCISVLEEIRMDSPELERLYYKIKNFGED
jgi:hypothetical protein|tara:strand:- start:221 stop:589 length:369 start_codon:yes stop_codon:yes gene_type:complete